MIQVVRRSFVFVVFAIFLSCLTVDSGLGLQVEGEVITTENVARLQKTNFLPIGTFSPSAAFIGNTLVFGAGERLYYCELPCNSPSIYSRQASILTIAVSPNEELLAVVLFAYQNIVELWSVSEAGLEFKGVFYGQQFKQRAVVSDLAFSPDSSLLAVVSEDNLLRVWDVQNSSVVTEIIIAPANSPGVASVSFSSDGRFLAIGPVIPFDWDPKDGLGQAEIQIWKVNHGTFTLVAELRGHNWGANDLIFSNDSLRLFSAGLTPPDPHVGTEDGTIKIWSTESPQSGDQPIVTRFGDTRSVGSLILTPKGDVLLSAGSRRTIRAWDMETYEQLGVFLIPQWAFLYSLAMNADGTVLVSTHLDGIRFWTVPSA